jgi:hypothetical protein
MEKIPFEQLVVGNIYRVRARNLSFGVFDGQSFLGIREKFGSRYLDREFYKDGTGMGGTASPTELLGRVPEGIPLTREDVEYGIRDRVTERKVGFDKPVVDGGKGWFFADTGESSKEIRPTSRQNQKLFDYLNSLDLLAL